MKSTSGSIARYLLAVAVSAHVFTASANSNHPTCVSLRVWCLDPDSRSCEGAKTGHDAGRIGNPSVPSADECLEGVSSGTSRYDTAQDTRDADEDRWTRFCEKGVQMCVQNPAQECPIQVDQMTESDVNCPQLGVNGSKGRGAVRSPVVYTGPGYRQQQEIARRQASREYGGQSSPTPSPYGSSGSQAPSYSNGGSQNAGTPINNQTGAPCISGEVVAKNARRSDGSADVEYEMEFTNSCSGSVWVTYSWPSLSNSSGAIQFDRPGKQQSHSVCWRSRGCDGRGSFSSKWY